MTKRRIIVIVLLLATGGGGAWWYTQRPQRRADVIRVSGNIEVTDVELSFRLSGWVASRPADEGMQVRPGDVVALLDNIELRHQVDQTRAELGTAQAALAALRAGSRPEEIAQARAAVETAKTEVDRTALEFKRTADLRAKGVTSAQEYDNARTAADSAAARLAQVQAQYELVKAGPRIEDIQQGEARVEQLRQALALAQVRLGFCTLRSPVGGVVLSKNTEAGEFVAAGTPIITVGDLKDIWLRAYVDEPDMTRVHLGQRVKVYTDSPDSVAKPYEGYISFISPQAEFTPKNVQTQKERVKLVFRVKITIPNPELKLKPGVPADADILLNEMSPLAPEELLGPQTVPVTQPASSSSTPSSGSR